MQLDIHAPTPLEYFTLLVQDDDEFPLLEAAASLAQDEYPELDIEQILSDVDHICARLKRRIPSDAPALQRLRVLQQFFYRELNFGGNSNNYYEPDNSFVHAVLKTRRGIPISLAVIWLELARAVGLRAQGVSFPGHFMLKMALPKGHVILDPLTGQSLSREELSERLEPYKRKSGLTGEYDVPLGLYLQNSPPREIIARMLRNLKEIYRSSKDWSRMVQVQNRLIALLPQAWSERRDRALALIEMGERSAALPDLEMYAHHIEDALDLEAVNELIAELRVA